MEGISLTIADYRWRDDHNCDSSLTYWRTNLHTLRLGAPVNVEADVLVKLAHAQMMDGKPGGTDRGVAGGERVLMSWFN